MRTMNYFSPYDNHIRFVFVFTRAAQKYVGDIMMTVIGFYVPIFFYNYIFKRISSRLWNLDVYQSKYRRVTHWTWVFSRLSKKSRANEKVLEPSKRTGILEVSIEILHLKYRTTERWIFRIVYSSRESAKCFITY